MYGCDCKLSSCVGLHLPLEMGDRNERDHQMVVLKVNPNKSKFMCEESCKTGSFPSSLE